VANLSFVQVGIEKRFSKTATHELSWFFSVVDRNIFEMTEKDCHFGQNVLKYRLKNTFLASFNATVKHMTEMF